MKKQSFTQTEVAKFLSCTPSSINQWQQGRSPSRNNIGKIKEAYRYLRILGTMSSAEQGGSPTNKKQVKCKDIRNGLNLTVDHVADFLKVSKAAVYSWEKGDVPKAENFARIKERMKYIKGLIPLDYPFNKAS